MGVEYGLYSVIYYAISVPVIQKIGMAVFQRFPN